MNIPIPPYTPELEYHVYWEKAFSDEECQAIIDFSELAEFEKGRVGNNGETSSVRDSDVTWLNPTKENDWIHRKISGLVARANFDKFQLDLINFDKFQYTKYGVGQHYDWHNDVVTNPPPSAFYRKLSVSICLSDDTSYEGGEFMLCPSGNSNHVASVKMKRGDMIWFYSFVPHKVSPVTSGERLSLVTWALGPKFV